MKEMVLVGRGGEGVVLASQLLADALARAGFWVQSFPEFKAERRGAPISAFLRWDEKPIHRRYRVQDCDVLAVLSRTPPAPDVLARVRRGGLVVLNHETRHPISGPFEIVRVPASRIARDHGVLSAEGRPMANVAVLGACARLLLPDGVDHLEAAITARMGGAVEANIAAARDGYRRITRQHARRADIPITTLLDGGRAASSRRAPPLFPVSTTDSRTIQTGSWSLERPVLLEACNACAVCAVFCPEGAIDRVNGTMVIDYPHCKGCGICAVVCPVRNALEMEEVRS